MKFLCKKPYNHSCHPSKEKGYFSSGNFVHSIDIYYMSYMIQADIEATIPYINLHVIMTHFEVSRRV